MTPMISMKPSAISANSRPSAMPFITCGSRKTRKSMRRDGRDPQGIPPLMSRCLHLVGRRLVVGLQLAVLFLVGVLGVVRRDPAQDLEVVGLVGRLVVAGRHVDGLLHMVQIG